MFDLEGKNVIVNNLSELDCLIEYANKHGWRWGNDGKELNTSLFRDDEIYPFIICFKNNKKLYWNYFYSSNNNTDFKDIEKYLKPGKEIEEEMTAREFLERFVDIRSCSERSCSKCVLNSRNTKCNKSLCESISWKNSIDELLEIVASGRTTVSSPEKKAIENIEKLIQEKDYIKMTDEIKDSLKLAIEKLKEVRNHE